MRRHRHPSIAAVALLVALFAIAAPVVTTAATAVVNTATVSWENGDPGAEQESSSATLVVLSAIEVPTLDTAGLVALAFLVGAMAMVALRRRRLVR